MLDSSDFFIETITYEDRVEVQWGGKFYSYLLFPLPFEERIEKGCPADDACIRNVRDDKESKKNDLPMFYQCEWAEVEDHKEVWKALCWWVTGADPWSIDSIEDWSNPKMLSLQKKNQLSLASNVGWCVLGKNSHLHVFLPSCNLVTTIYEDNDMYYG